MKRKILIVDDEKLARDRIKRFLQSYPEPLAVFEADNGLNAIDHIKQDPPDVLLLDIQMPVMSGFDVLFQLENRNFQVIFQTAYDEFAVKAFEVNACDYILKPYTAERLQHALKKALVGHSFQKEIVALEKHLEESNIYINTIVSRSGTVSKILRMDDIHAFKSEDHYTFAITNESEFILDNSLSWLENKLDPKLFVRGHRGNLLNVNSIEKIGSSENSTVTLKNGTCLPISRDNRKKVIGLFNQK